MNTPRIVRFDWHRFRCRVERLRAEHDARTPAEAEAATADAFRRWGETPPASFNTRRGAAAAPTDDTNAAGGDER